jgi:transcriptional regulator with XRE-family HTH domain
MSIARIGHVGQTNTVFMTYIAGNLRYLRKLANLSQQAFAEKVGLNRGNIASYEKGSAEPSLTNLLKISRYFNVDLMDFIDRDLAKDLPTMAHRLQDVNQELPVRFEKESLQEIISKHDLDQGEVSGTQMLTRRSVNLEKIIAGLRQYHEMKLAKLENLDRNGQLLRLDYGRILEIAEDILDTNRQLVRKLIALEGLGESGRQAGRNGSDPADSRVLPKED